MNNIIKGLIALCSLLLLVLFVEWALIEPTKQATVESTAVEKSQGLTDLPKLVLAKQAVESYSQMVERPLFIQGRKPVAEDGEEQAVNEDVGEIEDLVLLGIYSIKGKTNALFNKKGKDRKYLKKSEGEDVAGWLLKEIKPDRVVLEQRGNKQTVMLRKPKPTKPLRKSKLALRKKIDRKKPKLNLEK